jgi:hypothetical protein
VVYDIEEIIVRRTLRVPVPEGPFGDGRAVARQFDVALMDAGYKLSDDLFAKLSYLEPGVAIDLAVRTLATVRKMVGDHVKHNVYFIDFPKNVPDTYEFWTDCLINALLVGETAAYVAGETVTFGAVNLLSLPDYGRYRHSYYEMLERHGEFIRSAGDRVTVLQAGQPIDFEARDLYLKMAAATVPGNDQDREDLRKLAYGQAFDFVQPQTIPVRENRALINEVRVELGVDPLVDTVTDVLRLACALSGGDVTLVEHTRFKSFNRRTRKVLLKALHDIVSAKQTALGDVNRYAERWKRLGGLLHPNEHPKLTGAVKVFAAARGDGKIHSTASLFEQTVDSGDPLAAAMLLRLLAPGMLHRAADQLLRLGPDADIQLKTALEIVDAADSVSGRVLFSLRQHVMNRLERSTGKRLFVNQSGRGVVRRDARGPISKPVLQYLAHALDAKIRDRVFDGRRWVIDPAASGIALPISGKTIAGGVGTLPRGSVLPVDAETLRFFMYWHQTSQHTDYDLSALMLTDEFGYDGHVSWTNYGRGGWAKYSGDITNAPHGASEFIDINLRKAPCSVVVPQVHIYSGEGFDEVKESFFGFMLRDSSQEGAPFEPRTVRMKSELRGAGRVAMPMMFNHDEDWNWQAVWLNLTIAGRESWNSRNQLESSRATTKDIIKAIATQKYLTVGYLADLAGRDEVVREEPVVYVGFEAPDNLPEGSTVITLTNLADLIPA